MLSPCWGSRIETARRKAVQGIGKGRKKNTGTVSEPIGDVGPKEGCTVSPDKCRDLIRMWLESERRRGSFRRETELDSLDVSTVMSQYQF